MEAHKIPPKRKQPPSGSGKANSKRVKLSSARSVLAQTSDNALNQNGELDVSAFVKARENEIRRLEESMVESRKALSSRAFQQVPRQLRRRTASHNVKRIPKRLQPRAQKEMINDNTPTTTSRARELSSKKRLRMELGKKAKESKGTVSSAPVSTTNGESLNAGIGKAKKKVLGSLSVDDEIKSTDPKTNTLSKPTMIKSKFRKRQIHKSWLPTHLFHTKRAHMTSPKDPLWRFAIPLTPTEKSYRATHRASWLRGCVAWDMSYMSTIGMQGSEECLIRLFETLGLPENILHGKAGAKWRRGTRSWEGWIRKREEAEWIAMISVTWSVTEKAKELSDDAKALLSRQDSKRRLFIRVHPSAFLKLWTELVEVAKKVKPSPAVEDLRFEIGSIEVMGPGATEALVGVLNSIGSDGSPPSESVEPGQLFHGLAQVTNPAALPLNAVLGFSISDPRLRHPPRSVEMKSSAKSQEELLEAISSWPLDKSQGPALLFDREARVKVSRNLPSQKSINRRKGMSGAGEYPSPLPSDPPIPIILLARQAQDGAASQGRWTILLPWKCVLPVWYTLMHYPLSSGGNPRFGGLQEARQISFEQGVPWFPGDFPGTEAGWAWEVQERQKRREEWEKRPRGKRIEWDTIDVGRAIKGELGRGWACDWERLFTGANISNGPSDGSGIDGLEHEQMEASQAVEEDKPANFRHLVLWPNTTSSASPPQNALVTVHISLLQRGVPTVCSRIYRLPRADPEQRSRWLALVQQSPTAMVKQGRTPTLPPLPSNAPAHEKRAALAASLLASHVQLKGQPCQARAGEAEYPSVPADEDLMGFITTGNFNLGEGRGSGIGSVSFDMISGELNGSGRGKRGGICIVREAGSSIGRVARWSLVT